MQQYIDFVINHWALCLALVVLVSLLIYQEMNPSARGIRLIDPQVMTQMINRENAIVIDIRDIDAFKDGHITDAINVPSDSLDTHLKKITKHKSKPIIITCTTGQKAASFGSELKKQSFEKVFALKGGLQTWTQANLPLVK